MKITLIIIRLVQMYAYGPKMKKLINPATPKNQENDLAMASDYRDSGDHPDGNPVELFE